MAADFIQFVEYLLPGFLASWIFYGFTAFIKPSQFERVIQALMFTIIVEVTVIALRNVTGLNFVEAENDLLLTVPSAVVLGLLFATFANHSFLHRLANRIGVSSQTSYPSEWFGVFSKTKSYVVLHLEDERRIYGWPIEWPSQPESGHFSLVDAAWLVADGDDDSEIELSGVDQILIAAQDVKFVEFMKVQISNQ